MRRGPGITAVATLLCSCCRSELFADLLERTIPESTADVAANQRGGVLMVALALMPSASALRLPFY